MPTGEDVVLHADHGPADAATLERLIDKARAAQLLGLHFALSTRGAGELTFEATVDRLGLAAQHYGREVVATAGPVAAELHRRGGAMGLTEDERRAVIRCVSNGRTSSAAALGVEELSAGLGLLDRIAEDGTWLVQAVELAGTIEA